MHPGHQVFAVFPDKTVTAICHFLSFQLDYPPATSRVTHGISLLVPENLKAKNNTETKHTYLKELKFLETKTLCNLSSFTEK